MPPNLRQFLRLWAIASLALGLLAWLADRLFPPPLAALDRPAARLVLARDGTPLRFLLPADERWRWPVTLDEVPADFVRALVAAEDRRFWFHSGVDPLAIVRATLSNLAAGEVVSGASTLPMQLARMARPGRRHLGSKLAEALRAVQISWRLDKRQQLELYLNAAPYGGNLEGVGAAAWFYFGKKPAELSLGETALLITLPRSPNHFDPVRRPELAKAARDRVLRQLAARGVASAQSVEEAIAQPVPTRRRAVPRLAPHASLLVAELFPAANRLTTTLDPALQPVAERTVRSRVAELAQVGIGNAAVVVVELESRAVRALVGSADFSDRAASGQVNGAWARRSPGSTLKPFLYAQAFDRGLIVPDSWLLDVPTDFGGYVAENYDGTYRGRVTAAEALVTSLNAPAVRLLSRLGLGELHGLLVGGGLSTLDRPPSHYGLPLVLGAGEVRLAQLVNLYATLAQGGEHRGLAWLERPAGNRAVAPERLFSRRAAELTARALVELSRPDLPSSWDLARGAPTVAWKTGTSYGHRDAWAVGFSGRYALGVWVGNFDGRPVRGISGSEHAGPLLFDLFRALGDDSSPELLRPSPVEDRIEVCAVSRELPGPYCTEKLSVPYVRGATRLGTCQAHRRVFVDRESGEILAGRCLGERPHRPRVLTVEPPELVAFWRSRGQAVSPLPQLAAACGGQGSEPPRIVSPDGRTSYRLRREAPPGFQRLPLVARAGPFAQTLYWYQDGELIGSGAPGERRFANLEPGSHEIVVVDDTGRSDAVKYRVE